MNRNERERLWLQDCPLKIHDESPRIKLAHGEGGLMSRRLLHRHILPSLHGTNCPTMDDAARLPELSGKIAITTDSYVVSPLFFPGGDIGTLAVFGTANDLSVSGARPRTLSLALIVEEGFPVEILELVLKRVAAAAEQIGIQVVTGDTKVVPGGAADGLYINTTGVGEYVDSTPAGPDSLDEGDEILVTGPIGSHGIAVLCAREELALEPRPTSDCAPLAVPAQALQKALGNNLKAMRDATRGGVAALLHEWAAACNRTLGIFESEIPVKPEIGGACELLGLDPLHIANEGTLVAAVAAGHGQKAVEILKSNTRFRDAAIIGRVNPKSSAPVTVQRVFGHEQPLDEPLGSPLPRIC